MSEETEARAEVREGQRIAKVVARAGLCSRRDAEAWIAAGRVTVNGKTLESPAYNVNAADDVRVDGKPLATPERTRLFLFHKPRGLVTTARDPEGRPTIFDALPPDLPRLVAVGRLDINTEGLLLLTNDGGLARVLELPATGWLRRYRVRAHGRIDQERLAALSDGLTLEGVHYAGIEARLDREQGSNVWITMGLREGKNREIRKVLEHLGLTVNRLIRVSFGPFELGDLAGREVVEVRTRVLRDQLGARLAKEAGADFDAPPAERPPAAAEQRREPRRLRPAGGAASAIEGKRRLSQGSHGSRLVQEAAPRRGPLAPAAPRRRRKHVSALRAEIAADAAGPRKRVERTATRDRRGRTIAVERHMLANKAAHSAAEHGRRGARGPSSRRGDPNGEVHKESRSNRAPDGNSRDRSTPARRGGGESPPEARRVPRKGAEDKGSRGVKGGTEGGSRAQARGRPDAARFGSNKRPAGAHAAREREFRPRRVERRHKDHAPSPPASGPRAGGRGPATGGRPRNGSGGGRRSPPKKR
jgi:23S rRNA pseudouridine2605 synthase